MLALICTVLSGPLQQPDYLYKADGVKPALLESDAQVEVSQTTAVWEFKPKKAAQPVTYIFCPGGLVEPTAYAPLARSISEKGYPVFLIKLGSKYDSLEAQKQDGVAKIKAIVTADKAKSKFVIGGHSLGGAITCLYAHENPTLLSGLLIAGSTHPRDFDLSGLRVPITKVLATGDGIARQEQMEKNRAKVPVHTKWVVIQGGNHAQFGWYSGQSGDGTATISREKQQELLLEATLELLQTVAKAK
jgi:dienelactone hydrolase